MRAAAAPSSSQTDFEAVAAGYVALTPLRFDLLDEAALAAMSDWRLEELLARRPSESRQVVTSVPDRGSRSRVRPGRLRPRRHRGRHGRAHRESFRYTVKKVLGRELPDSVILAGVGQPLMPQMQALSPEHAQELYDVYREYNHRRHDELIRRYEGMQAALEGLKTAGRRLGIVTSKSADTTQMAFAAVGIGHLFDAIVTAGDTSEHKPSPVPLLLCLERLGGGRGIYIGDSPVDIRAGAAAGLATAAVLWGIFSREELLAARPDYVLAAPRQIVPLCVLGEAPEEVER